MSAGVDEIKGRCPGALVPMASGDGLIVRVKPRAGRLAVAALPSLAEAGATFGNGVIELTRRANLQIRGVREDTLGPLIDVLGRLGLVDDDPAVEAVRNIVVGPLAGLDPDELVDMGPVAAELAERLAEDPPPVPAKFAFVLDGGGRMPLDDVRADVRLVGIAGERVRVELHSEPLAEVDADGAARMAVELAHATASGEPGQAELSRTTDETTREARVGRLGVIDLGEHVVVGTGVPFGQLAAGQLQAIADALASAGGDEIRFSPWRALYAAARSKGKGERLAQRMQALGLLLDDHDPAAQIDACVGAPACASGHQAARQDARRIAAALRAQGRRLPIHVSGCAKGCARSGNAALTLVGTSGGYDVIVGGTTRDAAVALVEALQIETALAHAQEATP